MRNTFCLVIWFFKYERCQREGHAWADMAILCRRWSDLDLCADVLARHGLPHQVRKKPASSTPATTASR